MSVGDYMREAWQVHVDFMYQTFGRRDPDCFWCRQTVYMALQGPTAGGIWTTDPDAEGPCSDGLNGPPTECSASPEGYHDVLDRAAQ